MVKEFEQQNEQDLAILLDPWLPRSKVTPEQREALEQAIRFAATVCLETCRRQGRRLLLGWTGADAGVRQGPASVKLLHELLEQLAVMRPATEGTLAALLDALPPPTLREALLIIVSTRPVNLAEEAERSARLSGASARSLLGRVDRARTPSQGDLADLIQFAGLDLAQPARAAGLERRPGTARQPGGAPPRRAPPMRPRPRPEPSSGRRRGTTVNSYLRLPRQLLPHARPSPRRSSERRRHRQPGSTGSCPVAVGGRGRRRVPHGRPEPAAGACRATWPTSWRWRRSACSTSSTRSTTTC